MNSYELNYNDDILYVPEKAAFVTYTTNIISYGAGYDGCEVIVKTYALKDRELNDQETIEKLFEEEKLHTVMKVLDTNSIQLDTDISDAYSSQAELYRKIMGIAFGSKELNYYNLYRKHARDYFEDEARKPIEQKKESKFSLSNIFKKRKGNYSDIDI